MIRVKEVIVVEGRYDTARLRSVVEALIVETNGFGIFKDKERLAFLRRLAGERGLLILTDSDSAGFVIRNHLCSVIPPEQIKQAFIPPIPGKERRKSTPSKEGLLGVEGVDGAVIEAALRRAGATVLDEPAPAAKTPVTTADFYEAGLTGRPDSAVRRQQLLQLLRLPSYLSASRLREVINTALGREAFEEAIRELSYKEDTSC